MLQAALNQSFSAPPRRASVPPSPAVEAPSTLASNTADSENASAPESIVSAEEVESWKAEYDSQVQAWRAESAEAREKAEAERQRWETVRASQVQETPRHGAVSAMSGWETVGSKNTSTAPSGSVHTPSIADSRDLVSGEAQVFAFPVRINEFSFPVGFACRSLTFTGVGRRRSKMGRRSFLHQFFIPIHVLPRPRRPLIPSDSETSSGRTHVRHPGYI